MLRVLLTPFRLRNVAGLARGGRVALPAAALCTSVTDALGSLLVWPARQFLD